MAIDMRTESAYFKYNVTTKFVCTRYYRLYVIIICINVLYINCNLNVKITEKSRELVSYFYYY